MNDVFLAINFTLMYAPALMLAAMGGVISERSGVVNIGIEGMKTIGALVGVTVGYYTGNPWFAFLIAGVAAGALALLHAIACITFRADQTVSGVAMNFLGTGLALFLARVFFDGAINTKSVEHKLPKILDWLHFSKTDNIAFNTLNMDSAVPIAFFAVFAMWFFLYKTKWGLRVLAVGEHPAAADTLGINVFKTRYACVIASGVLAGLGGAAHSIGVMSSFSPTTIAGQGFIALAAVIFGKWTPQGAMAGCLLFGFAQALVVLLGKDTHVPSQLLSMIPYVLTIIILILFVGKSAAPKADGVAYEKN